MHKIKGIFPVVFFIIVVLVLAVRMNLPTISTTAAAPPAETPSLISVEDNAIVTDGFEGEIIVLKGDEVFRDFEEGRKVSLEEGETIFIILNQETSVPVVEKFVFSDGQLVFFPGKGYDPARE